MSAQSIEHSQQNMRPRGAAETLHAHMTPQRMNADVMNMGWNALLPRAEGGLPLGAIPPMPTYRDYFKSTVGPELAASVFDQSDAKTVQDFDSIIAEFNAARETIIQKEDRPAIINFYTRLNALVNGGAKQNGEQAPEQA